MHIEGGQIYMWDDELTKANKAFLDQLPPEMVELASEAVKLQEKLEKTEDEHERSEIKHQLEMINYEILMSAKGDYSGLN